MRKRKFFRLHSYGITAVLILTALMAWATPSNGFGGEWLLLIAYTVYLICDYLKQAEELKTQKEMVHRHQQR